MTILILQERKLEKHWLLCNSFPELNHSLQEAGEAHIIQDVNKMSQVWESGNLEDSPCLLPTFMERAKSDWEGRPQTAELQRGDFGDLLSCLQVLQRSARLQFLWLIICVGVGLLVVHLYFQSPQIMQARTPPKKSHWFTNLDFDTIITLFSYGFFVWGE